MVSGSSIGILQDAVFTIQGTTLGDNGNPVRTLAGSPLTFKADKVTYSREHKSADHGTNQDEVPLNRDTKVIQTVVIETGLEKAANAPLASLLNASNVNGRVVAFGATATGASVGTQTTPTIGGAKVDKVEWDYAGPSTLKITLSNYGTKFIETNT